MNAQKDDDSKELENRAQRESIRLCKMSLQLRAFQNIYCIILFLFSGQFFVKYVVSHLIEVYCNSGCVADNTRFEI